MASAGEVTKKQSFSKAASGCTTVFPPKTAVPLAGTQMTGQQMAQVFMGANTAMDVCDADVAKVKADRIDKTAKIKAADTLLKQLADYLRATLGDGNPQLAKFGIKGRKKPVSTATTRAAGANKAADTRKGLGPTGKKQRKAAAKALKAGANTVVTPAGTTAPTSPAGK